jgi:ABC-2 type transport system permease protein
MEAKRLFNVVKKEFIDHITSRKFILILAVFLIISAYSMHVGIGEYNEALEHYKERISQIKEEEGPGPQVMPEKPSILFVFQIIYEIMPLLGAVLAIAMGFDLVTKEKESRSLKSLLSHPIYRDEIINGKALGGTLALVFAIGIAFILLFAMLLIFSIVPDMGEFVRIALFGAVTVLCLLTYFSIALMTSTISENSGKSFIYALIIFFAITLFVPMVGDMVAESVAGERPEPPAVLQYEYETPLPSTNGVVPVKKVNEEEWERYNE